LTSAWIRDTLEITGENPVMFERDCKRNDKELKKSLIREGLINTAISRSPPGNATLSGLEPKIKVLAVGSTS
jgi:hypothetical protein